MAAAKAETVAKETKKKVDSEKGSKTKEVKAQAKPKKEKAVVEEKTQEQIKEEVSKHEFKKTSDGSAEVLKEKKTTSNEVWGILHIYSSYNNTHLHVTDVTGSETITKVTGGMVTKSDRLKASPNVAMAAAKQISEQCHQKGITSLYVKLRAVGGHNGPMNPGPGSQAAIKMLTRYGIKMGRIEDVTPVPHDSCRRSGGKRGRRV